MSADDREPTVARLSTGTEQRGATSAQGVAKTDVAGLQASLSSLTLAPYIVKATALIGVRRRAGGNMFRHQLSTVAILLDYGYADHVLLKAAVIHDLFEDASTMPWVSQRDIVDLDGDGASVYDLVQEVTIRCEGAIREEKSVYLNRLMQTGTPRARVLKLADRISNLFALGFVHDSAFVRRYLDETRCDILPHARRVDAEMFREMSDLIEDRARLVPPGGAGGG